MENFFSSSCPITGKDVIKITIEIKSLLIFTLYKKFGCKIDKIKPNTQE